MILIPLRNIFAFSSFTRRRLDVRLMFIKFPTRVVALVNRLPTRKFHSGLTLTPCYRGSPSAKHPARLGLVPGSMASFLQLSGPVQHHLQRCRHFLLGGLHHQKVADRLIVESGVHEASLSEQHVRGVRGEMRAVSAKTWKSRQPLLAPSAGYTSEKEVLLAVLRTPG